MQQSVPLPVAAWPPRTPSKKTTFRTAAVTPEELDSLSECSPLPLQQGPLEEEEEDTPHGDPLLRYYSRAFHRLYKRLRLVKPVMIQESVAGDPWKLLISVTLLNKTSGKLAIPVFWNILKMWPTPLALSQADEMKLIALIQHLGTQNIRARRLITISKAYLLDPPCLSDPRPSKPVIYSSCCRPIRSGRTYPPTPISHLPGTGSYALDSYRIFCSPSEEWKRVMPDDKELIRYLKWKWAFEEQKEWIPKLGVVRPANLSYLELLITELAENLK